MSEKEKQIKQYRCNGCDGKFGQCEITLKGMVSEYTTPTGDDFPECPFRNTNPNWECKINPE